MTEPRWLNDAELDLWLKLRAVTMLLPPAIEAPLKAEHGLTFFEYYVLALVNDAPESRMKLSELAARTHSSISRLSHVVTRMEKQGHLERRACPIDGRSSYAAITGSGRDLIVEAAPGHVTTVRHTVLDVLDAPTRAGLEAGLDALLGVLDPAHDLTRPIA